MPVPPTVSFPHRRNASGFFDSICTRCHITVASARNEEDLALYEHDHVCNPIRLYQLAEDRGRFGRLAVGT